MNAIKIGIDLDGVCCRFDEPFAKVLSEVTGRDCPPFEDGPPVWEWPTHFGYTVEEEAAAWAKVENNVEFWETLQPEDTFIDCRRQLCMLADWQDVYFITSRHFAGAKQQAEYWLRDHLIDNPTVIIAKHKGKIAVGLGLNYFIDDRPLNVIDVLTESPKTYATMRRRQHNEYAVDQVIADGGYIADDLNEFLAHVK